MHGKLFNLVVGELSSFHFSDVCTAHFPSDESQNTIVNFIHPLIDINFIKPFLSNRSAERFQKNKPATKPLCLQVPQEMGQHVHPTGVFKPIFLTLTNSQTQ